MFRPFIQVGFLKGSIEAQVSTGYN